MRLHKTIIRSAILVGFFTQMALGSLTPPNIILIYADDLGYGDLSCNGATNVKTPNADRIAHEGINFSSGYASSSTCTPSRYSMLTGEYAFRQKGTGILPGDAKMIIQPGRATLPGVLKTAGYHTGIVGKWHLGLGDGMIDWNGDIKPGPNEVGFNESFIMAATNDRVPCVYIRNHKVENLDPGDPIKVSYTTPFPGELDGKKDPTTIQTNDAGHKMAVINGVGRIGYMTGGKKALWNDETMAQTFTKEAVSFIERSKEKPFFLYFATHNIHAPRIVNPKFVATTTMGPRGDSIAEFDWQVGQILETLDRLGLTKNTLVILSSDNGPVLHDAYQDNGIEKAGGHKPAGLFRGGKYTIQEGGTRVPLLVRWSGTIQPGKSEAIISQVDFPATFAALAGTTFPAKDSPDSRNMKQALLGQSSSGRDHVLEHSGIVAVRAGDWKLIPAKSANKADADPKFQLYNLANDPSEMTNLAGQHPNKVEELRKLLPHR